MQDIDDKLYLQVRWIFSYLDNNRKILNIELIPRLVASSPQAKVTLMNINIIDAIIRLRSRYNGPLAVTCLVGSIGIC
jgi:hypothetical protein